MDKKKIASTLLVVTGCALGNEALHRLHPEETRIEVALQPSKVTLYSPENHQESQDTRSAVRINIPMDSTSSTASVTVSSIAGYKLTYPGKS